MLRRRIRRTNGSGASSLATGGAARAGEFQQRSFAGSIAPLRWRRWRAMATLSRSQPLTRKRIRVRSHKIETLPLTPKVRGDLEGFAFRSDTTVKSLQAWLLQRGHYVSNGACGRWLQQHRQSGEETAASRLRRALREVVDGASFRKLRVLDAQVRPSGAHPRAQRATSGARSSIGVRCRPDQMDRGLKGSEPQNARGARKSHLRPVSGRKRGRVPSVPRS